MPRKNRDGCWFEKRSDRGGDVRRMSQPDVSRGRFVPDCGMCASDEFLWSTERCRKIAPKWTEAAGFRLFTRFAAMRNC